MRPDAKVSIELTVEQARQAAHGHPLGFMARETIHEAIYRLEAHDEGQTFPGDDEPDIDGPAGFDLELARRLRREGRPPWHLVLRALRDVRAELTVEDIFEAGTGQAFEDWRRDIEDTLSKLEFDFSEWALYHGILVGTLFVDLLELARQRGAISEGTVRAAARTNRLLALALGHYLPDDIQ